MSKHTSGPWQHGTENEGYFIANGELRPDIAKAIQSEADANLIAAAPDLLEALAEYVNADPVDEELNGRKRMARAAINKAIGEQT